MDIIKNKVILILFSLIILISSISVIDAHELDANQTDSLELQTDDSQEILSAEENNEDLSNGDDSNSNSSKSFLVLDNDADKEEISLGDYVTWILKAQNFGPDISKNTKVHNVLPDGLKYIKHTATKGTFNPKTGIWDIGDLSIEDGLVTLLITTKSLTAGEKINKAYITSDTFNLNNITYEEEEMDVISKTHKINSNLEKHASAIMYETGNPIFLIFVSLFVIFIPIFKK